MEIIPQELIKEIYKVKHPAIDFSLVELGIVNEIEFENNVVKITFAFPFPNIPIADALINSITEPVQALGYKTEYSIVTMSEAEKAHFLSMEEQGWKGM